eukprot:g3316.t1
MGNTQVISQLAQQIRMCQAHHDECQKKGDKEGQRRAMEGVRQLEAMVKIAAKIKEKEDGKPQPSKKFTPGGLKKITIQSTAKIFKILEKVQDVLHETLQGIELPVVIVVGDEKHGKSSLVQRLIGLSILPQAVELCTKVAIRVRLRYDPTIASGECNAKIKLIEVADDETETDVLGWTQIPKPKIGGEDVVRGMMEKAVENRTRAIRKDRMICIEVAGSDFPNIIFVDLPGLVVNDVDPTLHETTHEIAKYYLERYKGRSITLVVRALDADTGRTSQSLKLLGSLGNGDGKSPRIDPEMEKWMLAVFTKADLINDPRAIMRKVMQADIPVDGLRMTSNPALMTAEGGALKPRFAKDYDHDDQLSYKAEKERLFFKGGFKEDPDDVDDEDGTRAWNNYVKTYPNRVGINGVLQNVIRLYKKILGVNWIPKVIRNIKTEIYKRRVELQNLGLPLCDKDRTQNALTFAKIFGDVERGCDDVDKIHAEDCRAIAEHIKIAHALTVEELFTEHIEPCVRDIANKGCKSAVDTKNARAALKKTAIAVQSALDKFAVSKGPLSVITAALSRAPSGVRQAIDSALKTKIDSLNDAFHKHVVDQLRLDTPGGEAGAKHTYLRIARFPYFIDTIDEALRKGATSRKEKIHAAVMRTAQNLIDRADPVLDYEKGTGSLEFDDNIARIVTGRVMTEASDAFADNVADVIANHVKPDKIDRVESCAEERKRVLERLVRLKVALRLLEKLLAEIFGDAKAAFALQGVNTGVKSDTRSEAKQKKKRSAKPSESKEEAHGEAKQSESNAASKENMSNRRQQRYVYSVPAVACLFALGMSVVVVAAARNDADTKPNIVLFLTDDQDQMLGSSFPVRAPGGVTPMPKTKKLMVDEGAMFENMFIHVPICNPSRSTTLTGRYLHNIKGTNTSWAAMHVDMNVVHNSTFAKRLSSGESGYTVGLFGKYLNAIPGSNISKKGAYVPAGFDAWFANGGGSYVAPEFATYGLKEAAGISDGAIRFNNAAANYSTAVIGNTSLAWIRHVAKSDPSRPFFAYIAPKAAHEPFNPAPWYADYWPDDFPETEPRPANWNCSLESRRHHAGVVANQSLITEEAAAVITGSFKNRWRTLMSVDDLIARVIDVVETELDLARPTYFFYTSDHGFQLGEFNILMDKRHVYDWNTRIHLLVRGPKIARGLVVSEPATNVDLAPTFVALADPSSCCARSGRCVGSAVSKFDVGFAPFDGRSLLPLLFTTTTTNDSTTTGDVDDHWRREVFIEYYFNDPNDKCVTNCSNSSKVRGYPESDAQCANLNAVPNDACWSPVCHNTCYPTENRLNNFIAVRRLDAAGTLYVEYAEGNQSKADINFSRPDFYELFHSTGDMWQMENVVNATDEASVRELHDDLAAWFRCAGSSCP